MALYDNKHWLLSHIRNSYISSDDTGMCEVVMLGEDIPRNLKSLSKWDCYPDLDDAEEDEDDNLAHSFDIQSDMDFGSHRRRSNTAQRLEKLKKERKSAAKVKSIQWKENPSTLTDEERAELFSRKDFKTEKEKENKSRRVSVLTKQLEKCPDVPHNPFTDFAKFDGSSQMGVPTRRYGIFLTMLAPSERSYPLNIVVLASARVQELIGLVCFKYTEQQMQPTLREIPECYSIHIAEDDGGVDWDFPCLDPREIVAKFGFGLLALVEKPQSSGGEDGEQHVVTVILPDGGFSKVEVESQDITLREIVDITLKKRRGMAKAKGLDYQLERVNEHGIPLNLDLRLSDIDTSEFCMVRENSKRGSDNSEDLERMRGHMDAMEAPLYQSYQAFILNKVRARSEIHLGISGEKVEIDPVTQKYPAKFWLRHKAVTYDMDNVAACELGESRTSGRTTFRLVTQSENGFKTHELEAETVVANDIVQKVNHILELRSSIARRDYVTLKEKKAHRRNSFHRSTR